MFIERPALLIIKCPGDVKCRHLMIPKYHSVLLSYRYLIWVYKMK